MTTAIFIVLVLILGVLTNIDYNIAKLYNHSTKTEK